MWYFITSGGMLRICIQNNWHIFSRKAGVKTILQFSKIWQIVRNNLIWVRAIKELYFYFIDRVGELDNHCGAFAGRKECFPCYDRLFFYEERTFLALDSLLFEVKPLNILWPLKRISMLELRATGCSAFGLSTRPWIRNVVIFSRRCEVCISSVHLLSY